MGFESFAVGENDDHIGNSTERFKVKEGRKYHVSLAWWPIEDGIPQLEGAPRFIGAPRHYVPGVGYVINNGPEYTKLIGEKPKKSVGTVVIVWPTNAKGQLDGARLKEGDYKVKPWVFSDSKYGKIKEYHEEWHAGRHDLKVSCDKGGEQYQNFSVLPAQTQILAKLIEKGSSLLSDLVAEIQAVAEALPDEIGREYTISELKEKMGGGPAATASGQAAAASEEDVDEFLDEMDLD